ncbi:undecaprenyl/decaprenyl-phosphate alpha-N-acetylglucosaminyl 1-phosphate transferase [bacterium]|nr:undecaprenyl/decaprenyl-phosphate alpha-N-acetylglucosaminyl 1-phosphate transferase [bacterium]
MNEWTAWAPLYILLFIESLAVSALLARASIPVARRLGFVAGTGGRHQHGQPMPTLGGAAIVLGFLGVVLGNLLLAFMLRPILAERMPEVARYLDNIPSIAGQMAAILGGALAMSILGLIDDRVGLGPKIKLAVMILATLPLIWVDVRVRGFLPWPWLGAVITVVWVVFLTNSFNFLDNMDGLSGGVAAIVAVAFGIIAFFAGEWFMTCLYIVLVGCLCGFLRYNFHPARLFMGDNGSLFLGFLLGALSIQSTFFQKGVPTYFPVLTPLLVLGVPIFDTVSVMWIRFREGRSLMQGDRNHFSHRLVDLGMSQRGAVTLIYIVTAVVALGAVPLRSTQPLGALAILVQTALVFWIIHRLERTAKKKKSGV